MQEQRKGFGKEVGQPFRAWSPITPAATRMKVLTGEGGSSPPPTRPSPDEPTYVNLFKPGSYFSSYKRVTSKREREEWSDHADIEPFKWHDPCNPCACVEYWRRPPIKLGYSQTSPSNDFIEEFSSDEEDSLPVTVKNDGRQDYRWSEDSTDSNDEDRYAGIGHGTGSVSKGKANRSGRVVTKLSKTLDTPDEWMDPNLWKTLHEELVLQIFAKLPFRSLIRLRCVCKSWNSAVYDSKFPVRVPRFPPEAPFCIIFDHLVQGYSVYNPASHTWYRLPRSFFSFSAKKACLLASAGGLCLFEAFGYAERALFVVNPLNKSERRLPPMCGTGKTGNFLYVEMTMDEDTSSFKIFAVESIIYPTDDMEDDEYDEDDDTDEDNSAVNLRVMLSFQVYNSQKGFWEARLIEVDEKYKEIVSTALHDGDLFCLIRTLDNRYVVYLMGEEADDTQSWEKHVGGIMELTEFDYDIAFLHLFEHRGHLMVCGKSRSAPDLGVRIWQLDASRMKWKEMQRAPQKLRDKFFRLGWRSRVAVHGDYMWISGVHRELVMADLVNKLWCPVPQYTLGCSQDCSWNPSSKRRSARYRCTLFLFEPRLDLVA